MEIKNNVRLPGHRTIKTAVAVAVCLIVYKLLGREGTSLAIISAIICMQESVEKSISSAKARVIGTAAGGIAGGILAISGLTEVSFLTYLLCALIGIIGLIHSFTLLGIRQSTVISCTVFIIIITDAAKSSDPFAYSLMRTIDTVIGIVISVIINTTVFRPRERVENMKAPLEYEVLRREHYKMSNWVGGSTSELYIYPPDCFYSERNFDFRVSTATVDMESTDFTSLPGFNRHIMLIEGKMKLVHEGYHKIDLPLYGHDFFKGEWHTKSQGKCRDLNLMIKEGLNGDLETVKSGYENSYSTKNHLSFFALRDGVELTITAEGGKAETEILKKYDYIYFEHDVVRQETKYAVNVNLPGTEEQLPVLAKIECFYQ